MTATDTLTTIPGYTAGTWAIDPVHSEVGFTVRHMMVSKVRGRFTNFSGEIVTGASPLDSSVNVENHPTMTYRSTGVRRHGDDYIVDGQLTLKGVTKDVPLALELNGFGPDPYGGTRAGFTATAEISRGDFGVSYNAAIEGGGVVVSDKVTIQLEVEAVLQA
jgi:polyisoprenoid-binding protein YceI